VCVENEIPFLLQFLFGQAAGLAHRDASERMLRWCRAMDDWLAERGRKCINRTYRRSKTAWKRLLSHCGKPPWEITPADIHQHIEWMEASGYAPSTINTELGVLSRFYDWCAQGDIDPGCGLAFNPLAQVPKPKRVNYSHTKVLSRAEVRALLAILKRDQSILGQRDYAFFLARLTQGVPTKKLLQLQWGQVECRADGVWLRWGGDQSPSRCPPELWDAVQAFLGAAGRVDSIQPEGYIFAPLRDPLNHEPSGLAADWIETRHVGHDSLLAYLKMYGRLVGIPEAKLTLMALRHTAVLLRREAGDNLEQIQAFLGTRALPRVTRDYLNHLPPLLAGDVLTGEDTAPGDKDHPAEQQPPLPERVSHRYKPGERLIHGFYAHKQPEDEVAAVLAEDIQGMGEEIEGLRMLSRRLIAAQSKAGTSEQVARLGDAYTQAAARQAQISKAERQREECSEDDQWVNEWMTVMDEFAAEADSAESDADGEDDDGELPSEEFWRMVAEADPEMQAASTRLTEEIASTRLVLRRLYPLAIETEDEQTLVRYTDKYGQSCIRLMHLLKAEQGARGRAAEMLREMIDETILEVNKEFGLDLG
jgi:integrase